MRRNTPVGTLYRRALARVERRSRVYVITRGERDRVLLAEAVRTCNMLARMLPVRRGG